MSSSTKRRNKLSTAMGDAAILAALLLLAYLVACLGVLVWGVWLDLVVGGSLL